MKAPKAADAAYRARRSVRGKAARAPYVAARKTAYSRAATLKGRGRSFNRYYGVAQWGVTSARDIRKDKAVFRHLWPLNLSRWMVLFGLKVLGNLRRPISIEWDEYARNPGTAWAMMRPHLFLGVVAGELCALLVSTPLLIREDLSYPLLSVQYLVLVVPLSCAVCVELFSRSREDAWNRRPGVKVFDTSQFTVDVVRNRALLLGTSFAGYAIALFVGAVLAVFDPMLQGI